MSPTPRNWLVRGALVLLLGFPVFNIVGGLLFGSRPDWTSIATIGGRIAPDDDLVPASDPAFASALHAQYHFDVARGARDAGLVHLAFGVRPPIAPPPGPALRAAACRVGRWLASSPFALHPAQVQIEFQPAEGAAATPPISIDMADCAAAA